MKTCEHHYLGPCPTCHAPPPSPADPTTADEDWEEFDRMANPTEPTTAEAFQAARDAIGCIGDDPAGVNARSRGYEALALVERRMRELEKKAAEVDAFWSDPDRIDI